MRSFLFKIVFLSFVGVVSVQAQDPVFSQYYNAPLLLNPAFAGNTNAPFITANYRNQWPSLASVYKTYAVSYDQFMPKVNSGIGGYILADDSGEGSLKTTKIAGIYSYRLRVQGDMYLKGGIDLGYVQTRLDWSKLTFLDQLDPQYGKISPGGVELPTSEVEPDNLTNSYLDISTGVMLHTPLLYAGISLKHMNRPDNTYLKNDESTYTGLPLRVSLHGGFQINFDRSNKKDEGSFLSPNLLFVKQGDFTQWNIGAYGSVRQFFAGVWYRQSGNGDALIASMGWKFGIFKMGYSFDLTISDLGIGNTGGSHEIGIIFNFDSLVPKESRYNDCLSLFR